MRARAARLAVALWLAASAVQAGPAPRRLSSPLGVSIALPAGWRPAPRSDGAIEMLSPGPGAQGVVIARDQADILVSAVDIASPRTLAEAMSRDVGDDRVVSRSRWPAKGAAGGCGPLQVVDTLDEVGPGTDQRLTLAYCTAGGRAWRIALRCWQADPARMQRRWRAAALAVARSLRASPLPLREREGPGRRPGG